MRGNLGQIKQHTSDLIYPHVSRSLQIYKEPSVVVVFINKCYENPSKKRVLGVEDQFKAKL